VYRDNFVPVPVPVNVTVVVTMGLVHNEGGLTWVCAAAWRAP